MRLGPDIYTGMAHRYVSVSYTGFLAENAQVAKKEMKKAGIDYDLLVSTPEDQWDGLPGPQEVFMRIRKAIGPNNGLLGLYARIMCDDADGATGELDHESRTWDSMVLVHSLIAELGDRLSELADSKGNKKGPLQFTRTDELIESLERLTLRDFPSKDKAVRDLLRAIPKRVFRDAWRKIYRNYEYQYPYEAIRDEIDLMLKHLTWSKEVRKDFMGRMKMLNAVKRPLRAQDLVDALRDACGDLVVDKLYPSVVGIFGHDSLEDFKGVVKELSAAGIRLEGAYLTTFPVGPENFKKSVKEGMALVILPIRIGEYKSDIPRLKYTCWPATGVLKLRDGTRFRVGESVVPLEYLREWMDEVRDDIVGPWKPLLKKKLAMLALKSMRGGKGDD